MSTKQLYIPDKIKIGYQKRDDTFSGTLAYVIYYDMKGVLRKETSWQSWRDKKIPPIDENNKPIEGFVLNKKVGGYKSHWNFRDAHVRVYDPRGFEFEISVPNLLFILTQCDCSRGKGLEGQFVYAWEGTELVLLPIRSEEYQNSKKYTVLQATQVKAKDLVPGASYLTKKQVMLTYVGKFDYHQPLIIKSWGKQQPVLSKRFVFWDGKKFVDMDNIRNIAATVETSAVQDLAELTQLYYKGPHGSPAKELFTKKMSKSKQKRDGWRGKGVWTYPDGSTCGGVWVQCYSCYQGYYSGKDPDVVTSIRIENKVQLVDGALSIEYISGEAYPSGTELKYRYGNTTHKWVEPTDQELWAKLESGSQFRINYSGLIDPKETDDGEDQDD